MSWRSRLIQISLASSLSVGVIYLVQPLLKLIADDFGISTTVATIVASMFLVGYAVGVLTLIALSDRIQPRTQVQVQAVAVAGFLALAAFAPNFVVLCIAAFGAGVCTTIAQILLSTMIKAAPPEDAGSTTGVLVGAFLTGLFGSRILAGVIGSAVGWRPVVAGTAVLMLAEVPVLRRATPVLEVDRSRSYWSILRSLPRLVARNPVLRIGTFIQFSSFAGFQALWSLLALHLISPPISWSVAAAGAVGAIGFLAGVVSIAASRLIDRFGVAAVLGCALILMLASAAGVAFFTDLPVALIAAFFGLTLALQIIQVSTQSRALRSAGPMDTGRANSVYMFGAFIGGSAGTAIGGVLYGANGFAAVAVFAIATTIIAGVGYLVSGRRRLV